MVKKYTIKWSDEAKKSLKFIYQYYKEKSLQGAKNVVNDLLQAPKTIHFAKQYQLDEINPKYRRIVIRDYKILYLEKGNIIEIIDVVSTKELPSKLASK